MREIRLNVSELRSLADTVSAGDRVILSGTVYTARDAAHKRLCALLDEHKPLPFPLAGSASYYAGPTPAKNGLPIGSCGPTTSSRMDPYLPRLFDAGLRLTIGKGDRSPAVYEAIKRYGGAYLLALGGAGALVAQSVRTLDVIAFPELGCESVKRLVIEKLPLYVGIDATGASIFSKN